MNATARRRLAADFASRWQDRGNEQQDTQSFWLDLLQTVFGLDINDAVEALEFEKDVKDGRHSRIDCYIASTLVLIEQKSHDIDLSRRYRQSDGTYCTPYEQALRYAHELPRDAMPKFIVVCNFQEFWVYDQNHPHDEPYVIKLAELKDDYPRLSFLNNLNEIHLNHKNKISLKAGEAVGRIYDALLSEYENPQSPETLRSLNILCVRLVFCLYAQDSGLFAPNQFSDFVLKHEPDTLRRYLRALFDEALNTPPTQRSPYLERDLASFPYVDGGLFAGGNFEIPRITPELQQLIAVSSNADFNWSRIDPTIFGAIFESTLNPQTRRSGGMHYTSIDNIHKIIDPLFLNDLKQEFDCITKDILEGDRSRDSAAGGRSRAKRGLLNEDKKALLQFQNKLASLHFLDPACGCGNFLTETFICLRRLENRVLNLLSGSGDLFVEDTVKVSIEQFHGIEINDFAVAVARTALWIAEAQMLEASNAILTKKADFLPLHTRADIIEANAHAVNWPKLIHDAGIHYIMGNPPFAGYSLQGTDLKADLSCVYQDEAGRTYPRAGKIDYAAAWFFQAARAMQGTAVRAAFVATNSLTQGDQVSAVWEPLFTRFNVHIDFAYPSFKWESESTNAAAVHVVIVGFSCAPAAKAPVLFAAGSAVQARSISPYLRDEPTVFLHSRNKPLSAVPSMTTGNRPSDGGHLIIEAEDYEDFIKREPRAEPYLKKLTGAKEFINGLDRWCLWLTAVSPAELRRMPLVMERIKACREARLKGAPDRRKLADTPTLFRETLNPEHYLLIPLTSSQRRAYLPIGFLNADTIPLNSAAIIPEAGLYEFSILSSSTHTIWLRAVCGRLKSDLRYSKDIVYNNFPWPQPDALLKTKLEQAAQQILEARAQFPRSSPADIYDPLTMPPALRRAHQANDELVLQAYGLPKTAAEKEILGALFALYLKLTAQEKAQKQGRAQDKDKKHNQDDLKENPDEP